MASFMWQEEMVLAKTTGSKEGRKFPSGFDSSACVRVGINHTGDLPALSQTSGRLVPRSTPTWRPAAEGGAQWLEVWPSPHVGLPVRNSFLVSGGNPTTRLFPSHFFFCSDLSLGIECLSRLL